MEACDQARPVGSHAQGARVPIRCYAHSHRIQVCIACPKTLSKTMQGHQSGNGWSYGSLPAQAGRWRLRRPLTSQSGEARRAAAHAACC